MPAFPESEFGVLPQEEGNTPVEVTEHGAFLADSSKALKKNAPSPTGAASKGAFGEPASAGEPPKDMLQYYNNGTEDGKEALTREMTDKVAAHGKSLEGSLTDVLKAGGPQAWARAAKFGIDLEGIAQQVAGKPQQKAKANVGVAFGSVPEKDKAGTPPFKTQDAAIGDFDAEQAGVKKKAQEDAAAKKKAQRQAMAAFLMETGLRILASDKPTAAGAFGEAALGTSEAVRQRKAEAAATGAGAAETARKAMLEQRKDTREQEEHDADKGAGRLGKQDRTAFEIQRDSWMESKLPEGASKAQRNKEMTEFFKYYARESRVTATQRENIINDYIALQEETLTGDARRSWRALTGDEMRAKAIKETNLGVANEENEVSYADL